MRLVVVASHLIQYQAPLFRTLAQRLDLVVLFAHRATPKQQGEAGFGVAFEWDADLSSGYQAEFLSNVSKSPGTDHFGGCDTPDIGARLHEFAPDAVLVLGWNLKIYWQAVWAAKRLGIPVMIRGDSHLDTPRSKLKLMVKALFYPLVLRMFDVALFVGLRNKAYFEHYGYPESRLFSSPHCVDTRWFAARATLDARTSLRAELGLAPETKAVLFGGKLMPFKRPLDLIAAAALCRANGENVEVIIAGDGEMKSQVIASANIEKVPLHFLGFRNQSEMPRVYAAADCLVLPSNGRETWGLVTNEALACGLPVIVSSACGCAPDILASEAGHSFPEGDVDSLSRAISNNFADPPSVQCRAAFSQSHGLQAAVDGITAALGYLESTKC